MRFILLALAIGCGGSSVEWAGSWRQPVGIPAGSLQEATGDLFRKAAARPRP